MPVLLALMAYACNAEKDEEFSEWLNEMEKQYRTSQVQRKITMRS